LSAARVGGEGSRVPDPAPWSIPLIRPIAADISMAPQESIDFPEESGNQRPSGFSLDFMVK
jgi:hypothetical protein